MADGTRPVTSLSIGDLAGITGVSRRSLRHYDSEGLLPSRRLPNGYRSFDVGAIARVRSIRSLLELGLPLNLAKQILPCVESEPEPGTCVQAIALLDAHGARLDTMAQEASRRRDATAQLERRLSTS